MFNIGMMIQCESCDEWQHCICIGIRRKKDIPNKYICSKCTNLTQPDVVVEEIKKRPYKRHKPSPVDTNSSTCCNTPESPSPTSVSLELDKRKIANMRAFLIKHIEAGETIHHQACLQMLSRLDAYEKTMSKK